MTKNGNYFKLQLSNHKQTTFPLHFEKWLLSTLNMSETFLEQVRFQKYFSHVKFFRYATFLKTYSAVKIKITQIFREHLFSENLNGCFYKSMLPIIF